MKGQIDLCEVEQRVLLAPAVKKSATRLCGGGFLLIVVALMGLFVLDAVERRWLAQTPWHGAIRTVDYAMEDPEAMTVWSWELTPQQSVGDSELAQIVQRDLLRMIDLEEKAPERLREESPVVALSSTDMLDEALLPRARLLMFAGDASVFETVLDSGRLPVPGQPEVLAGPLVSERPLELDGVTYTVVGRLHPYVSGFVKTFVMPEDEALRTALSASLKMDTGSVHLTGVARVAELIPVAEGDAERVLPVVYGGQPMTRPDIAWGVWTALLVVASGATCCFMGLFRYLTLWNLGFLNVVFQEIELRRRLLWSLYVTLFGAFFWAMAVGMQDIEMNYLFTEFASHEFTEGGLQYVGDAYKSGNIPRAAQATFQNNFVMQTVMLGALPSLVLLGVGVLKTLASFVVVGFAMAPVWSGTASGMTYHAITLALELPPYVLAAFGMIVWAIAAARFVWSPVQVWYLGDKASEVSVIEEAARQLPRALLTLVGTVAIAALFLYIAAWYEAATLILFR